MGFLLFVRLVFFFMRLLTLFLFVLVLLVAMVVALFSFMLFMMAVVLFVFVLFMVVLVMLSLVRLVSVFVMLVFVFMMFVFMGRSPEPRGRCWSLLLLLLLQTCGFQTMLCLGKWQIRICCHDENDNGKRREDHDTLADPVERTCHPLSLVDRQRWRQGMLIRNVGWHVLCCYLFGCVDGKPKISFGGEDLYSFAHGER